MGTGWGWVPSRLSGAQSPPDLRLLPGPRPDPGPRSFSPCHVRGGPPEPVPPAARLVHPGVGLVLSSLASLPPVSAPEPTLHPKAPERSFHALLRGLYRPRSSGLTSPHSALPCPRSPPATPDRSLLPDPGARGHHVRNSVSICHHDRSLCLHPSPLPALPLPSPLA